MSLTLEAQQLLAPEIVETEKFNFDYNLLQRRISELKLETVCENGKGFGDKDARDSKSRDNNQPAPQKNDQSGYVPTKSTPDQPGTGKKR